MTRAPLTTAEVLALLSAAPARLAKATDGLPADALRSRPEPDEWSAVEVLAHLRACADVWGGAVATVLDGAATLRAVNPRTWVTTTGYADLEPAASLEAFTAQRRALVRVLDALPAEGWRRSATVTGAGRPLERTVLQHAQRLAGHERAHLRQVERLAAAARTGTA